MNRITVLLNSAIMALFGAASSASQCHVDNVLMYPGAYEGVAEYFPAATVLAIHLRWCCWAIPAIWLVVSLVVLFLIRKMELPRANSIVQLHTSATVLIGLVLLVFFVLAGVMPFVPLVCGEG
jgi:hypothetical protein